MMHKERGETALERTCPQMRSNGPIATNIEHLLLGGAARVEGAGWSAATISTA